MKRATIVVLASLVYVLSIAGIARLASVHAQAAGSPLVFIATGGGDHTTCPLPSGIVTQGGICVASDGLWVSAKGGAWAQVQTAVVTAGVTSISVNGGIAQTGPVSLTIPTKVTITSQTTSTGTIQ